jgi:hypothetical protein
MNIKDKITKTEKALFSLTDEGIIHQEYPVYIDVTLKDSQEELSVIQEYCKNEKRPMIVDIRRVRTVQRESRQLYSSDEVVRHISATALLVGNPVSRITGNFFLGLNKAQFPVKLFTNKDQAIKWLRRYL